MVPQVTAASFIFILLQKSSSPLLSDTSSPLLSKLVPPQSCKCSWVSSEPWAQNLNLIICAIHIYVWPSVATTGHPPSKRNKKTRCIFHKMNSLLPSLYWHLLISHPETLDAYFIKWTIRAISNKFLTIHKKRPCRNLSAQNVINVQCTLYKS